jgi:hypothetical protein
VQRLAPTSHQHTIYKRLFDEVQSAEMHSTHRHWNLRVRGQATSSSFCGGTSRLVNYETVAVVVKDEPDIDLSLGDQIL